MELRGDLAIDCNAMFSRDISKTRAGRCYVKRVGLGWRARDTLTREVLWECRLVPECWESLSGISVVFSKRGYAKGTRSRSRNVPPYHYRRFLQTPEIPELNTNNGEQQRYFITKTFIEERSSVFSSSLSSFLAYIMQYRTAELQPDDTSSRSRGDRRCEEMRARARVNYVPRKLF